MKRLTWLLLACSLFLVFSPDAFACRAYYASDTYRGDIKSADLNDFAYIFESAGDPWGCAGAARVKLETKLSNMPSSVWSEWLSGGAVSYIMAAGLFINFFEGPMPASLDQKIRDVANAYQFTLQKDINGNVTCGFDSFKWQTGNTCLEDYGMDASAQAWIAAYMRNTGRAWTTNRSAAISAMSNMLAPTTTCIRKFDPNAPKDLLNGGPCNGTYTDLVNGTGEIVSLNHGQQSLAYGIGQMTSFGSAVSALDVAERPFVATELASDRRAMAGYLFAEAAPRAFTVGTDKAEFSANGCFWLDVANMSFVSGQPCYDTQFYGGNHPSTLGTPTPYRADMFKVKPIYTRFGFTIPSSGYQFDRFYDLYLTGQYDWDKTWGIARKYFYGTMGSWWVIPGNRPAMQGRGEYYGGIKRSSYFTTAANLGNVTLSATTRAAGSNANFTIVDQNGGSLRHNDPIAIKNIGGYYWTATNGGGSTVVANSTTRGTNQTFTIVKITATAEMIAHGDQFAIKAPNGQYLSAPTYGGNVTATAATIGTYEKFTLDRTKFD